MHPVIDALNAALAGRYRLERELGMGGMATVYLADDLRHDRKVAVKVLKPELAAVLGAERFVVEIKTTASLQHPHILPLFDSGSASGYLYYVMPYIEGETLRDKLNRETQFAIDEGVRIAREVADALDYAHRHGVIHRDIKPENILLHDGRPMVADFGIALAVSAAAGGRMTETGLSLGTPHYMSPEQATAEKEITARADVYSLASVLYEMLAGEPPHMGNSAQQIIMKIIAEPVQPVTKLRKSVPPNVSAALSKALEKLPADRFATAKEFADALSNASFTTAALADPAGAHARRASPRAVIALAGACAVLFVAAVWGWLRGTPDAPLLRYELAESRIPFTFPGVADAPVPTPSADGSFLVFHGPGETALGARLYIKRREHHAAAPIPGTTDAASFAISPDGEWIVFAAVQQLRKVPVAGGPPITLVSEGVATVFGVAWLDDNTIVYVTNPSGIPQLAHVPATGGEATVAWSSDKFAGVAPEPIAGHRAVLFARCQTMAVCDLWALDLRTGDSRAVAPGVSWAQYATTGHVVLVRDGHLLAMPFDARSLEPRGTPFPLADSISGALFPIRLSRSGVFVTRIGLAAASAHYDMVWVTRTGVIVPVDTSWRFRNTTTANNHGWALSRDGTRLAIGLSTEAGDDIWIKELPRGATSRLTYNSADEYRPRWNTDGSLVSFVSNRAEAAGTYARRSDFTGGDSLLHKGPVDEAIIAPDGSSVLVRAGAAGSVRGGRNILRGLIGDTTRIPLIVTEFDEEAIALSPDSKWLAYQSDETGRTEVFVKSYPNVDGFKRQISNGGGEAPLWSRDGRELFYINASRDMMSVSVTANATATALTTAVPMTLFRVPGELLAVEYSYYTPWDVAPDGRFIMARRLRSDAVAGASTVVAENWLQELVAKTKR